MNGVFSFFDSLTGVCRKWLTLPEPEYCPTSLPVRIPQGPVSSWLAPVLLWSTQFLYQASMSVSHEGPHQIHLIKQSYHEKANSKLNKYRDLNTQLCWLNHTITQLSKSVSHEGPYLKRALTIKYCTKYNDSLNESALLVERWTIRYLAVNTLLHCLLC